MLNTSAITSIHSFAKENKINKAKLESFVSQLLEANTPKVGRKQKATTAELRQRFQTEYKNLSEITSASVAEYFQVDKQEAINCLTYFTQKGMIRKGEAIKVAGKKGRASIKFEVNC